MGPHIASLQRGLQRPLQRGFQRGSSHAPGDTGGHDRIPPACAVVTDGASGTGVARTTMFSRYLVTWSNGPAHVTSATRRGPVATNRSANGTWSLTYWRTDVTRNRRWRLPASMVSTVSPTC